MTAWAADGMDAVPTIWVVAGHRDAVYGVCQHQFLLFCAIHSIVKCFACYMYGLPACMEQKK
ncbi:MAG: hypothetical protein AAGK74_09175, partial [Chloroflexota bacterium]